MCNVNLAACCAGMLWIFVVLMLCREVPMIQFKYSSKWKHTEGSLYGVLFFPPISYCIQTEPQHQNLPSLAFPSFCLVFFYSNYLKFQGPILLGLPQVVQAYRPCLCHEGTIRPWEGLTSSTSPAPHHPELPLCPKRPGSSGLCCGSLPLATYMQPKDSMYILKNVNGRPKLVHKQSCTGLHLAKFLASINKNSSFSSSITLWKE